MNASTVKSTSNYLIFHTENMQIQHGGVACGLLAIVHATELLLQQKSRVLQVSYMIYFIPKLGPEYYYQ